MSDDDQRPLEPSADEMRRLVDAAVDRIVEHVQSLPRQPSNELEGSLELGRSLVEERIPTEAAPLEELLALLFERAVPKSYNTISPGFMAYIPGGGLFHSAVADLIAASVNRYSTVWAAAPGLATLEANVVRWFCEMVGYPEEARGFLTTGGSLANFSAIFTARRERLPENFLDGTIYVSDQIHHSVRRAAGLAGFPSRAVRSVGVDDQFRIRIDELERSIDADREAGRTPFLVNASAGTTNTGAVDDLAALADLCEREDLWLHIDAAYGGFFMLTERGRRTQAGLERADSVTLDPHKGLFLPYGTGCLLVRDGAALKRAHAIAADYMPPMQDSDELVDFCNISPELSRGFRGLRIWLPMKLFGVGVFRDELDEKLDLVEWATAELERIPEIEIVARPQLSVVAFRRRIDGLDDAELNRVNRDLIQRINDKKRVFITGTMLDGWFVLRICVVSFRTHEVNVRACLEDLRAALEEQSRDEPAGARRSKASASSDVE